MQDLLSNAIALHQAGQLPAAAELYQQILSKEPDNADGLHLLGVLHHQQGDHARAIEEIGRAVALRPNVPLYHVNLAEVYRARGQLDRAMGCCRMGLRLQPEYAEAHNSLGLVLQGLRRQGDAAEEFRQALRIRPDYAAAHSNLGIALRELGEFDEALSHFRRAAELAPEDAPARTNLGQMLVDQGQAEEALPHCREAVRLQPDAAVMHHNLGNCLRALEQFTEARAAYLEAIRLDPNLAKSHAHLGLILQQQGELADALTWLKQATELDPNEAEFWENLAELQAEREERSEAIACWERAVALKPDRPTAHNGLGSALQDEERLEEAEKHFREALRLKPDFAGAQVQLGGLQEELGKLAEAETSFREALRLQPAFPLPHARLATLLRGKLPDADLAAMESRLSDAKLENGPRARLLFGLAHVLDARGDYPRAADCLRQANAMTLEEARRRKREYASEEHDRFVERLIGEFGREFFDGLAGAGSSTRRPVFVFGLPRSGTTLIEQVLGSHSQVHAAGELRLVRDTFAAIPAALGRPGPPLDCIAHLDAAALAGLAAEHQARLIALAKCPSERSRRVGQARTSERGPTVSSRNGGPSCFALGPPYQPPGSSGTGPKCPAERVVDKMPDNYLDLGLLAVMFPQATFIHCRRDLRDVAVSCWMTDFGAIRWANDFQHIASRFQQYRRIMEHWRAVLPVPICEVDYEAAVADLEGTARRLVAACGLEWEPACLEFYRLQRPVRTASIGQVRQPVYTTSVARWKNYDRDLAELFAMLPRDEARP